VGIGSKGQNDGHEENSSRRLGTGPSEEKTGGESVRCGLRNKHPDHEGGEGVEEQIAADTTQKSGGRPPPNLQRQLDTPRRLEEGRQQFPGLVPFEYCIKRPVNYANVTTLAELRRELTIRGNAGLTGIGNHLKPTAADEGASRNVTNPQPERHVSLQVAFQLEVGGGAETPIRLP